MIPNSKPPLVVRNKYWRQASCIHDRMIHRFFLTGCVDGEVQTPSPRASLFLVSSTDFSTCRLKGINRSSDQNKAKVVLILLPTFPFQPRRDARLYVACD